MSSNVQPLAWTRYLRSCASLGYKHEATVETNMLQRYKTLYTRYCQDNGLQFDTFTHLDSDVDIQRLSKVLLLNLCEKLGYESIIQIRRNISMLTDQVHHQLDSDKFYYVGSTAEGFRISTSDVDHMIVFTDNVVINNITETSELLRTKLNEAVITMETQHTKTRYVRLILETDESTICEKFPAHAIITMTSCIYRALNFGNTICPHFQKVQSFTAFQYMIWQVFYLVHHNLPPFKIG